MTRYVFIRIVRGIVTLWIVTTLVFFGMRATGDPVEILLGDVGTVEDMERLREIYGLNDSVLEQYRSYLWSVVQGDFGRSIGER